MSLGAQLINSGIPANQVGDGPAFHVAAVLMSQGELEAAAESAMDLLYRYGTHPEAEFLLALYHDWQERDFAAALTRLERVVEHRPTFGDAWFNLGLMAQRLDRHDDAERGYQKALALLPDHIGALVNYGNLRLAAGDIEGAIGCYDRAQGADSADPLAIYNRAIAFLLCCRWEQGWKDYEARWRNPMFVAKCPLPPLPRWDGKRESIPADGRLMLLAEQGIGDTIMTFRYAHELNADLGPDRVVWRVQRDLLPLCQVSGMRAVADEGDWPEATHYLPTMSLMHVLGMRTGKPYLGSGLPTRSRRVGLVYAGSDTMETDRLRSIPADHPALAALREFPVEWVDLQVGRGGTFTPKDWLETAHAIAKLDLLISVDTAPAHLAGAMGIPVWILLSTWGDYRWGHGGMGDTTVWYDSARLFRQTERGNWAGVLERVRQALTERYA